MIYDLEIKLCNLTASTVANIFASVYMEWELEWKQWDENHVLSSPRRNTSAWSNGSGLLLASVGRCRSCHHTMA